MTEILLIQEFEKAGLIFVVIDCSQLAPSSYLFFMSLVNINGTTSPTCQQGGSTACHCAL